MKQICENGYAGLNNPKENDMESYEKVVITPVELDDGEITVSFDVTDDCNVITKQGGHVSIRQDDDDNCFYVTAFDAEGNVLFENQIPFNFKEF